MKNIFAVLLLSLIWSFSYSQINESYDDFERDLTLLQDDSLGQIKRIDKEVVFINNNLSRFKKIEKMKDKDGYRYVYFKGEELKMIHVLFKDTVTKTDKDVKWYFDNGHMIYAEKIWTYPTHNNMITSQEKCYLYNDDLVGWTRFDKPVAGSSSEFKEYAKQLKDYAQELEKEKP